MPRPKKNLIKLFHSVNTVELDASDRKLLAILQQNNQVTTLELAEKANLSPPTCLRRLRRLRKEGVIVADISLVDPAKVGKTLTVFVEIVHERTHAPLIKDFQQRIQDEPEIMQSYVLSGDTDFLLVVMVDDMPAYQRLVRRFFLEDPSIKTFRSRFVLNRSKFKTAVEV